MRSYHQYCAIAKSLDVIGDRWNLLIVRELLLRDGSRYTDLRDGLPGIATNLLAERLRQLETAGIVSREEAPPPVATALFRLTDRGKALRPVLQELLLWGLPYMQEGPAANDEFRSRWAAWPAELSLHDREPSGAPIALELRTGEAPLTITSGDGQVIINEGATENPDATLTGDPLVVLAVLTGEIDLPTARKRGLQSEGNAQIIERLLPERAS